MANSRSTNATDTRNLPRLLLANRNFLLLWLAAGISAIGDHLSEMALLKEVGGLERADVTRVQALLTFGFFLPFVVIGPIAGWWADRFSRRWTMVASDMLRAVVMFSLTFGTVKLLTGLGFGDFSIFLPMLLTGAFAAFFSPSRQAMIPTLIRDDQLVRANAMIAAVGTIGAITSGLLGGLLVDMSHKHGFSLYWNYRLDALTFVLSAVLLAMISMRLVRTPPHRPLTGMWTPLRQGFRYVGTHRRILQIILLGTAFWASAGVVISVVPAIVRDVFSGEFSDVGMYRGLIAAGLAIGAAVLTLVGPTMPLRLIVLGSLAGGAFWVFGLDVAYVLRLGRIFTGLCLFMIGVHGAGLQIAIMVVIQRFVPDSRRGRVFGVSDMCTMAAIVASTAVLGLPKIDNLDHYIPYLLLLVALGLGFALWRAWLVYRRGEGMPAIISVLWPVVQFHAAFWSRLKRDGICTVPIEGPVIVVANHTSGIDPILIEASSNRRLVGFLVDRSYYRLPVWGWLMRGVGCIPVDREAPSPASLREALRRLKDGACIGVFPHGGIPKPGEAEPPIHNGIGLLALRSGATVIPCYISGTRYVPSVFRSYLVRHRARIRYGKPVDLSEFADRRADKQTVRAVTERIMGEIERLAPQTEDAATNGTSE